MKTKNIFAGFMAFSMALLVLPAISMANTYQFIDTSGNLQSIESVSPKAALEDAYRLGIHSGVILVTDGSSGSYTYVNTSGSGNYYQFIDTSGNLQGLWATNSSAALDQAYQLGVHSGVILVD